MIKIYVSDYCHSCPAFNPTVNTLFANDEVVEHAVTCINKDECRLIGRHLEQMMKKDKEKER